MHRCLHCETVPFLLARFAQSLSEKTLLLLFHWSFLQGAHRVGTSVGALLGTRVGCSVGLRVGFALGTRVGVRVGATVGTLLDRFFLGVGENVGTLVGCLVGTLLGLVLGVRVGARVGGTHFFLALHPPNIFGGRKQLQAVGDSSLARESVQTAGRALMPGPQVLEHWLQAPNLQR
jgi:hypothetical protein